MQLTQSCAAYANDIPLSHLYHSLSLNIRLADSKYQSQIHIFLLNCFERCDKRLFCVILLCSDFMVGFLTIIENALSFLHPGWTSSSCKIGDFRLRTSPPQRRKTDFEGSEVQHFFVWNSSITDQRQDHDLPANVSESSHFLVISHFHLAIVTVWFLICTGHTATVLIVLMRKESPSLATCRCSLTAMVLICATSKIAATGSRLNRCAANVHRSTGPYKRYGWMRFL